MLGIYVPKSLDHVILNALSKNPNDRYQTAKDFKNAIDQALLPENNGKSVVKNSYFMKYALFFILSISLLGITYFASQQNLSWKSITSIMPFETTKFEKPIISHTNLTKISKVSRLLKVANAHKLVGRYIAPQGSNAYATFQLILSIDPNNHDAKQGLQQVNSALLKESKKLIGRGKIDGAIKSIEIALSLYPDDTKLLNLLNTLKK